MSSEHSSSETNSFGLLDQRLQRWIWAQGWTSLRAVQEHAIPPLLAGAHDVILAAATSAGKTEAAFFPLLTRLLAPEATPGFILSISPLKALINDQTQRLLPICELLDLPILGWHGDVPASRKHKFLKSMSGILIITPESLEALFVNKGTTIPAFARAARCVVIDELHSFIGSERGKQVQSLLNRLEIAAGQKLVRVGLSATLGDEQLAAEYLRPGGGKNVETIDAASESYELKLIIKGYSDEWAEAKVPQHRSDEEQSTEGIIEDSEEPSRGDSRSAIAEYIYTHLRGSNNLIFPNSRAKVEDYADQLRRFCERDNVPNEFWPHHGSLSRDLREESEAALKSGVTAASAICTTTLELGIDIGSIISVAQIGAPPSVASMRQRLGRSGRRKGESAILRCFIAERKLSSKSPFSDLIREDLVQTIAMVRLLLGRWVEPPRPEALHASTLVQQLLSVIAQNGGSTASELWSSLVRSGVFSQIASSDFADLLQSLGTHELITQESSGLLLPGPVGEKLINQFEFYSAFTSGEEFRIIAEGRTLGSLPVERPLSPGQRIIFGGRRWKVQDIDTLGKAIFVSRDPGGAPPTFNGAGGIVHDRVRQEMKQVLAEAEPVPFLDPGAATLLAEGRSSFRAAGLEAKRLSVDGNCLILMGWHGDTVHDALALLLTARGLQSSNEGIVIRVFSSDQAGLINRLREIAAGPSPTIADLGIKPDNAIREKWDWALPQALRIRSFASTNLDLYGAQRLASLLSSKPEVGDNPSRHTIGLLDK